MTFFRPTFSSPGKHSLVFSHSSCETRHTDICWYNILLSLTQYLQHGDGHHIKGSTVIQKHSLNWATVHVHSDVEGFEVLGHFLTCFSNKILLDFTGSGSFSGCCSTVWVPWCALPGLAPVSTGSAAAYCACCSTSSVLAWKRKGNPKNEWFWKRTKTDTLISIIQIFIIEIIDLATVLSKLEYSLKLIII